MTEFRLPSLGADMEKGTLVEWLKAPGDRIARGDVVAVVETQKGAIEIEVFQAGTLVEQRVPVGTTVPVGTVIAILAAEGEAAVPAPPPAAAPAPVAPTPVAAPPTAAVAPTPAPAAAAPPPPPTREPSAAAAGAAPVRRKITPAARRRAGELGLDLAAVPAGPGEVVGLAEIERMARPAPRAAAAPKGKGVDFAEMRRAIAALMERSHREIPAYTVTSGIDVSGFAAWLEAENGRRSVTRRLLYLAPLLKAVALALRAAPELNGTWEDGAFRPSEAINIGVAVAMRGGGLIAPAIRDVDRLDLDEIMTRLADLVARVRGGRLRSSEMTDGTVTVSSLGEDTADALRPLIYPPQVAIVGFGRIAPRPWAVGDALAVRRVLTATVVADHRASDGRRAAAFLNALEAILGKPEAL